MNESILDKTPLSPDTEAILLLCGRFGNERAEQISPLTQKEYEALTRWLLERKLRPADLLDADNTCLGDLIQAKHDQAKISALLLASPPRARWCCAPSTRATLWPLKLKTTARA